MKFIVEKPFIKKINTFIGDLELMRAWYEKHTFSRHYHDGYGIGAIEKGAMEFFYRGKKNVAPAGEVNTVSPGEVHDGHSATGGGWIYRMIYFDKSVMSKACELFLDKTGIQPVIKKGVIDDKLFFASIYKNFSALTDDNAGLLEQEEGVADIFSYLLSSYTTIENFNLKIYKLGNRLKKVEQFIHENYDKNISLSELSEIANVGIFHFARSFKADTGLTPIEYLTQTRIDNAKKLIESGMNLADVALETGFADQSHLTRKFRRQTGFTPGQYIKFIQ